MTDKAKFISGLIVKAPNERAPEYVKAKISIKREELIAWLQQQSGEWINADVKVSQGGKWYAAIDDWKPERQQEEKPKPKRQESKAPTTDEFGDEIPF